MMILKLLRVKQWIKNIFVLIPLLFSGNFLNSTETIQAIAAFAIFCFASSFVYIINDIADMNIDKADKKNRPIAMGQIKIPSAVFISILCLVLCGISIYILGNIKVASIIIAYIIMNIFYSFKLKHVPIADVFCVSFGFILRVYAGAYAINVNVSSYLFMTVLFLSLFLAFGKRKHQTKMYSEDLLDKFLTIFSGATILSYALWTLDPAIYAQFGNRLIYSVVFVIAGLIRYMMQIDKSTNYNDPTENLYNDRVLLGICAVYVIYILFLYGNA